MSHPRTDLEALSELRKRLGVESAAYQARLAELTATVEAVGVARFLDDLAGSTR